MPLVLALEPDPRQAEALTPILERVGAELVLARSRDDAVRALALRVPDLILVSVLISPREEAEFTSYLRTLPDTAHLQTLSIPMLAQAPVEAPAKRRRFGIGRLMSRETSSESSGCSPEVFADEIRAYLERGSELRIEVAAGVLRLPLAGARHVQKPESAVTALEPQRQTSGAPATTPDAARPAASSNYWAWDSGPAEESTASSEPMAPDGGSAGDETSLTALAAREEAAREQAAGEMAERTFVEPGETLIEQARAERESRDERDIELRTRGQAAFTEAERAFVKREEAFIEQARAERENRDERDTELRAREQAALAAAERALVEREETLIEQARAERESRDERETELRAREQAALAEAGRERGAREAAERGFAERERAAEARAEAERLARDEADRARIERDRLERAEAERLARETAEHAAEQQAAREAEELAAREAAARERAAREEAERAEREQAAREQEARERQAREDAERERAAREAAERALADSERLAGEEAERQRERERLALELAERERVAREAAERERQVLEQAARELAERERLAREQAARELAERERLAEESAARERLAHEEAERERLAREAAELEFAERERLAREEAERERLAREAAESERAALEQATVEMAERERLAREDAQRERVARETAERELAAREAAAEELTHRERRARKKAARERLERERSQKRGAGGSLVLVQPAGTYTADEPASDPDPSELAAPVAGPGHQPFRTPSIHSSRSGWEEAERELAERQAEREHIHRERVVRELTVQAEALAEAVRAAQQLGTVAPPASPHRAVRREDAPARGKPSGARTAGVVPRATNAPHAEHSRAGDAEPVSYDALYEGGDDDTEVAAPADVDELSAASPTPGPVVATIGERPRRQRPAPLALWAHRGHYRVARTPHGAGTAGAPHPNAAAALSDLHAILKALNIPAALAEIGYAAGCHIKRVRVRRRAGPRPVEKNAPVVILSRRALERLRPVIARRSPPDAAVARG